MGFHEKRGYGARIKQDKRKMCFVAVRTMKATNHIVRT